jgi:hypothetical protein
LRQGDTLHGQAQQPRHEYAHIQSPYWVALAALECAADVWIQTLKRPSR